MRILILILTFFMDVRVHADMIFLDLNDAGTEYKNCEEGIADNNQKFGRDDRLEKVSGVILKDARGKAVDSSDGRTATYHALRSKIVSMLKSGRKIDSIVISGEDGNGHFFGTKGDFQSDELQELVEEFPQLSKTMKSSALWGCYTTSLHGAEQHWLNKLPGMQFTMGFTLQGPEKSRPANHALLKQFCEKRNEAVEATSKDQLCAFYYTLKHLAPTSVGLCNRNAIVSSAYRDKKGQECFSPEELYNRCGEFINNKELQQTYNDFLTGKRTPDPDDKGKKGGLRDYYNKLNMWRHCREKFKVARGYDMPYPPEVIRLIKYNKIRENLADLNKRELADYDRQLVRAGLGDFAIGDLKDHANMDRGQLNKKIQNAISALRGETVEVSAPQVAAVKSKPKAMTGKAGVLFDPDEEEVVAKPVARTPAKIKVPKDPALLRMAQCMRQTLVNMDWRCTMFKNINVRMGEPSKCLKTYEQAKLPERDDDDC